MKKPQNIISLLDYKKKARGTYPYLIVFKDDSKDRKNPFLWSPKVMALSPTCSIHDLRPTLKYWQQEAEKVGSSLEQILQEALQKNSSNTPHLSLLCDHPFQGLLLAHHLKASGTQGFFSSDSLFNSQIFKNISWRTWIFTANIMFRYCETHNLFSSEQKAYPKSMARLQRFIQRLQLQSPFEMSEAHFSALQRRFSKFIARLWRWTFYQASPEGESVQTDFFTENGVNEDFPWIYQRPQHRPKVFQFLDFPLSTWSHLEPHLLQNFETLARDTYLQSPCKIVELQWTVTLFDMETVTVQIPFRFPYSLETDSKNNFKMSLAQMALAFNEFQKKLQHPSEDLEIFKEQLLIGWKLEVSQSLVSAATPTALLPEDAGTYTCTDTIKSLQNKIESPIQVFAMEEPTIPFFDFSSHNAAGETPRGQTQNTKMPLPFFIHPKPVPIEKASLHGFQFLERTSASWWESFDRLDTQRDYFIASGVDKRLVWVFKDYQNQWFEHGLYS